jgi:hypothetical protein
VLQTPRQQAESAIDQPIERALIAESPTTLSAVSSLDAFQACIGLPEPTLATTSTVAAAMRTQMLQKKAS